MRKCKTCEHEFPATTEFFYKHTGMSDGLSPECKECIKARSSKRYDKKRDEILEQERIKYAEDAQFRQRKIDASKQWAQEHPDELKEYRKIHYHENKEEYDAKSKKWAQEHRDIINAAHREARKNDPEKSREYSRRYKRNNREKLRQAARVYAMNNPEKAKARSRRWRQANPERVVIIRQSRQARKMSLPYTFTVDEWKHAIAYFGNCCAVCGCSFEHKKVHADHWIPLFHPDCPGTTRANMIPLCGGRGGCNQHKAYRLPETWIREHYDEQAVQEIIARINAYFASVGA